MEHLTTQGRGSSGLVHSSRVNQRGVHRGVGEAMVAGARGSSHVTSTTRKQRGINGDTQLTFSLLLTLGLQPKGGAITIRVCLPTSVTPIQ